MTLTIFREGYAVSNNQSYFESKYINSSILLPSLRKIRPSTPSDQIGLIPFCEVAPKLSLSNISAQKPTTCDYFGPMLTSKGFCYSFNSLTMNELFKASPILDIWNSRLELKLDSNLTNPTGYGTSNGLNFALNSFEPFSQHRSSKNFLLSITNPMNPFSIFEENFVLKPGYIHTFKIIANEIVTTDRFKDMDMKYRNCSLPHEIENLKLLKIYSKSGCIYECAIENAKSVCKCSPWFIPQTSDEELPFCDEREISCFANSMTTFQTRNCNCQSDCQGISFSIFESKAAFENPGEFCSLSFENAKKKLEYPKSVFCGICKNIVRNNKMRFVYEKILNDGLDINKNFDEICNKLLNENVALVKIEMVTKSITRSIKDERYNFVAQLSSLGKCWFLFLF